ETYYTSDGIKTIKVFATDNAGSVGNVVTYRFDLNPPTQLQFAANGEPPATAAAGQNFAAPPSPVIVDVEDANGNIVNSFAGQVTLALANGANGAFVGTLVVNAVNGVATFKDLEIDTAGTYMLAASSPGLTSGLSTSITIGASTPAQLTWTAEPPSTATEGFPFGAALQLTDRFGNLETGFGGNISL